MAGTLHCKFVNVFLRALASAVLWGMRFETSQWITPLYADWGDRCFHPNQSECSSGRTSTQKIYSSKQTNRIVKMIRKTFTACPWEFSYSVSLCEGLVFSCNSISVPPKYDWHIISQEVYSRCTPAGRRLDTIVSQSKVSNGYLLRYQCLCIGRSDSDILSFHSGNINDENNIPMVSWTPRSNTPWLW